MLLITKLVCKWTGRIFHPFLYNGFSSKSVHNTGKALMGSDYTDNTMAEKFNLCSCRVILVAFHHTHMNLLIWQSL